MNLKKCWPLLSLFSATVPLVSLTVPLPIAARAQQAVEEQPGSQATATALKSVTPTLLASPPQLTPDRQAELQAALARKLALGLTRPTGRQVPVTAPPDGAIGPAPDPAAAPPVPGNPFVFEVSAALNPSSASTIGEPSLAQTGGAVFYTGNWYAAVAKTAKPGPADWKYINPAADMPDFCCDQDAIADPGRDIILWTRLGSTRGRFLISASTNLGTSFCTWELNPAQLGLGGTYDQPLMALSNNNVYISAQVYGPFHNVLLRISLDTLQDCPGGGFNYTWWDITDANGWGGLVSGATTTMYFGSHRGTNNSFRIFSQPENSGSLFKTDNNIPAFTFQNGDSNCPVSGTNPCARSDSRVQAGWVRKGASQTVGEVGFMWNAHEGGFFPWAYLEAATFREDTLAVTGRPMGRSSIRTRRRMVGVILV